MANLQELLATKEFWFFYQLGEDYALDEGMVKKLTTLNRETGETDPVAIQFKCPLRFSIELEICLDFYVINLMLVNGRSNKRSELGWWDEARWHPFALRWNELQGLLRYWKAHPSHCPVGTSAALLLLARFVGNAVNDINKFPARKKLVAAAYSDLGLFTRAEVKELVEGTLVDSTEDDYRWTKKTELGWVFGGEYACYSIRNAEHSDGSEGRFPFADWNRLMTKI
jgi:hypothetical protein